MLKFFHMTVLVCVYQTWKKLDFKLQQIKSLVVRRLKDIYTETKQFEEQITPYKCWPPSANAFRFCKKPCNDFPLEGARVYISAKGIGSFSVWNSVNNFIFAFDCNQGKPCNFSSLSFGKCIQLCVFFAVHLQIIAVFLKPLIVE